MVAVVFASDWCHFLLPLFPRRRAAILNLQLHLEPANKSEIQYLKSVDILGKRAPSCSLLNVRDLLKLLYCFDKKRHAEDLKHALKDEERLTPDDPSAVLLTRINTKQAPKPIVLRAAPKTPIPADAFSVRAIEITLPKGAAANLLKRARAANGGAAISDRKRKTASVDAARGASGAAATPSRMDDAGSGLLQLLSALGKPQVDDDVSDPAAADIEGELVSGVVDADGFVLPQAKRSKMSAQVSPLTIVAAAEPPPAESPMHAALRAAAAHHAAESPLALALVSAAQVHASSPLASPTAYYSPSSSFGLKRPSSVASLPAAALLGGATPYKSSPLDRGDSPYTQALFSTRAALPSAVVVPVSPAQRATAPLPGGSGGSGSFYRHLLSPSPSPAPSPQLSEASMAVFEPITTPV